MKRKQLLRLNGIVVRIFYIFRSVPHCWKIMSEDSVLSTAAVLHFIRLISGSAVYDEQVSRDRMRIAMHQPLAVSLIDSFLCYS